jgi:hypothetical protein
MGTKEIKFYDYEDKEGYTKIFEEPDTCPICDHKITAKFIIAFAGGEYGRRHLEVVYKCPNNKCAHLFIAYFHEYVPRGGAFTYMGSRLPLKLDCTEFPETISEISKEFPIIYNQAFLAEHNGLDQICGAGYRRALEFLIKDYLISQDPENAEEIKKLWLGKAIAKIASKNIRLCAERAVWLGNDETHYVRIWEDKDIQNLKDLISLTFMWIDSEHKTKKYAKEMT